MIVKSAHVMTVSGLLIMLGHVGILPYIFFGTGRVLMDDRIDIAFLIGPLTAAYFLTVVRAAMDNRFNISIDGSPQVNLFFVIASVLVVVPFVSSLYVLIYLYDNYEIQNIEMMKRGIGVIEIFFGGAFALFVNTMFGNEPSERKDVTAPVVTDRATVGSSGGA